MTQHPASSVPQLVGWLLLFYVFAVFGLIAPAQMLWGSYVSYLVNRHFVGNKSQRNTITEKRERNRWSNGCRKYFLHPWLCLFLFILPMSPDAVQKGIFLSKHNLSFQSIVSLSGCLIMSAPASCLILFLPLSSLAICRAVQPLSLNLGCFIFLRDQPCVASKCADMFSIGKFTLLKLPLFTIEPFNNECQGRTNLNCYMRISVIAIVLFVIRKLREGTKTLNPDLYLYPDFRYPIWRSASIICFCFSPMA